MFVFKNILYVTWNHILYISDFEQTNKFVLINFTMFYIFLLSVIKHFSRSNLKVSYATFYEPNIYLIDIGAGGSFEFKEKLLKKLVK